MKNNEVKFDAATVTHFLKLDSTIKTLSKERDAMKAGYKAFMIDNELNAKDCGVCVMKVTDITKTVIDNEYLKTHYPEIYNECLTEKTEKRFTF